MRMQRARRRTPPREAAEKTRMQEDAKRVADAEAARQVNPNTSADKEEQAKRPLLPSRRRWSRQGAGRARRAARAGCQGARCPGCPGMTPVPAADARSATPEQQAAAAAQKERDDAVAAADAQHEEAEKRRMQEDEARVAGAVSEGRRVQGCSGRVASAADASSPVAPARRSLPACRRPPRSAGADLRRASKSGRSPRPTGASRAAATALPTQPRCANAREPQQTDAVPSPSPLVTAADVEERPLTKEEKAAQKAIDERDAKVAGIDKQRAKEDAERIEQDAKRVADMYRQRTPRLPSSGASSWLSRHTRLCRSRRRSTMGALRRDH